MKSVWRQMKLLFSPNKDISLESSKNNSRRILFGAPFVMAIHIFFILFFLSSLQNGDETSVLWKQLLLITHGIMLILESIAFLLALYLRKAKEKITLTYLLQFFVLGIMIFGSISIASIDQLATQNITAYVLINLLIGTFLLVHPFGSIICYFISYCTFYFLIALKQPSSDALLSSRLNGFAAVVIGFVLSLILWRQYCVSITQSRRIDDQRKELEEANKKLKQMAFMDPLTGLSNRLYFDQVLQKEISLNSRKGFESYLIMLDIDLFKNINDMYGHPAGDALLIEIGKLLSSNIRQYDTLSRLGGEEFLLLLPQTNSDEAIAVAEKLRRLLETHAFCINDYLIHITASFGVSRLSYTSDPRLIAQYAQVDNALYQAKQSGRNCIKIA